jgi:hypothetical protein
MNGIGQTDRQTGKEGVEWKEGKKLLKAIVMHSNEQYSQQGRKPPH